MADELELMGLVETAKVVHECYAETLMCTPPTSTDAKSAPAMQSSR